MDSVKLGLVNNIIVECDPPARLLSWTSSLNYG